MRLITLIFLLIAPSFVTAENYLCITDAATGFSPDNGTYVLTNFTPGDKYLMSTKDKTLRAFGNKNVIHRDCDESSLAVLCSSLSVDFNMHKDKLRFIIYAKSYGYVWENTDGTPHIAIGTCSKF